MQTDYKQFYKRLWSLDLPSKIKITNWRFSCNFLPTFGNLHYRRLMASATCQRCQNGTETKEHVFRECSVNRLQTGRWVARLIRGFESTLMLLFLLRKRWHVSRRPSSVISRVERGWDWKWLAISNSETVKRKGRQIRNRNFHYRFKASELCLWILYFSVYP